MLMLHVRLRFRLRAMHHSLCNSPRTIVYIWALWASLYARDAQSAPSKNALEESCRQRWDGCEILPTGSDFRETLVQWSRNGRQKQTDLKKVNGQAIRTVEKDGVWDYELESSNQAMKCSKALYCMVDPTPFACRKSQRNLSQPMPQHMPAMQLEEWWNWQVLPCVFMT